MPITNSYTFPASGFARCACLTPFSSGSFLAEGTYEDTYIYVYDGANLNLIGAFPTIFGAWVFGTLNGQIPTNLPAGGIQFLGGATGSINWASNAFTSTAALQLQVNNGGISGFNNAIPGLVYTVVGDETFTLQIKFLDIAPQQIGISFYVNSWANRVWWGGSDLFGFGGTHVGSIPGNVNVWNALTFTAADLGLSAGDQVVGLSWGIWQTGGTATAIFSDITSSAASSSNVVPVIYPTSGTTTLNTGFIDCDQDGGTGFYLLQHHDNLLHIPLLGSVPEAIQLPTSPSLSYEGMAFTGGAAYCIGDDGTIYKYVANTNTLTTFANPPGGVTGPARELHTDGISLYTMFPASNDIAACRISSQAWTLSGSPFAATLDTMYVGNGHVVVGGSDSLVVNISGTAGLDFAPIPNQTLVANPVSNTITAYNYLGHGGAWQSAQVISGAGSPSGLASTPTGTQVLVPNPTNNIVQILTFSAGAWTSVNLSVVNPIDVAITPNGVQALVCSRSAGQIVVLNNEAGTWITGQQISVPNTLNSVVVNQAGTVAMVSTNAGVSFLSFNGAVWQLDINVPLNPGASVHGAIDSVNMTNPFMYTAGVTGGNTTVYIFNGETLVGQYTFAGSATALEIVNYQIAAPLFNGSLNVGYCINGSTVTISSGITYSNAVPASGGGTTSIFIEPLEDFPNAMLVAGSTQIKTLFNSGALLFDTVHDAKVAIVSGGSWSTTDLQDRNRVSSVTMDTSGNIFAISVDNDLYQISSLTHNIASGFPYVLTPPPNQESGIPIGASHLVWNDNLYSSTSLTGGVIKISIPGVTSSTPVTSGLQTIVAFGDGHFAHAEPAVVYVSNDGGASFNPVVPGGIGAIGDDAFVTAISDGMNIIAGETNVYSSDDGGQTFTVKLTGDESINPLFFGDSQNPSIVFTPTSRVIVTGSHDDITNVLTAWHGVAAYSDNLFTTHTNVILDAQQELGGVSIAPDGTMVTSSYGATSSGASTIYTSTDNGATWPSSFTTPSSGALWVSINNGSYFLVFGTVAHVDTVYKSTTGGTGTWTSAALPFTPAEFIYQMQIVWYPVNNKWYAFDWGGFTGQTIYSSTDGLTWNTEIDNSGSFPDDSYYGAIIINNKVYIQGTTPTGFVFYSFEPIGGWVRNTLASTHLGSSSGLVGNAARLCFGTSDGFWYYSDNEAVTWTLSTGSMPAINYASVILGLGANYG